jgi:DNA repair protein RadD
LLNLRPYQEKLLADTREAMRQGRKNVLDVLPTGGGKTVVAAALASLTRSKGKVTWFLCHRDFLLHQTSLTFDQMELGHGFIAAGRPQAMHATMVCSVDTLRARKMSLGVRPDVIVWDEAHHIQAESWKGIREWAGEKCHHIGLTATPQRLDGKGLGPPFEAMVLGPTTAQLMELGHLSRYKAFAPSTPDLTGVHTVAGDYNQREMAAAVEKSVITGDIVRTYVDRAERRRAVYFCPSIAYSCALAQSFNDAGIAAMHVDGETPTAVRIAAAVSFARGELQVLTNCSLFGEGYDLAAQAQLPVTIDVVGLVRPTKSLALHLQQVGRCLRPKPYPAIILDHAGNLQEHGLPDEDRLWSLQGMKRKKASLKICPHCQAVNPATAVRCVACDTDLRTGERRGPRTVEHVDGELVEIDAVALSKRKRDELRLCQTKDDFRAYAKRWGYKPQWVFFAWRGYLEAQERGQEKVEAQARAYLRR